ncbi:SMI1/KNR4 family protein [Fimbriiglobus ruber]|uniref:SMI1/KNR4 family protein n=1 Tax=Fimbriiglobus ruber TaxID=1908690 RepID=UPI000B4AC99B|nr:SMI1/KNR4 family protein [Fimbriiglobus ruber]
MPRKPLLHRDVAALELIVPFPATTAEIGPAAEWTRVERELGIRLPSDYKCLIDSYGSGSFGDFLYPLTPFAVSEYGNFLKRAKAILEAERSSGMWRDQGVPFSLYPDTSGLFPWAVTDNGNTLYWYTHGPADHWPVVVQEGRGFRFEVFQRTAAGFVRLWLTGQLSVGVFPAGPFERSFRPTSG